MVVAWTDEAVARLKKLYEEGYSSSEIARRLYDLGRWSRNAVIGKIDRLHLRVSGRPFTFQADEPPADHRAKPKTPRSRSNPGLCELPERELPYLPPEPDEPETMVLCTLYQLTNKTCRFPIGDPREAGFCFCGNDVAGDGCVYCAYHTRISYTTPAQRRAEATANTGHPYYGPQT